MNNILVHLHPDFSDELENVLKKWNDAQNVLHFHGVHPPKEVEATLLASGADPVEETFEIAAQIRDSAGYSSEDVIMN
jgi:hypothetical protein